MYATCSIFAYQNCVLVLPKLHVPFLTFPAAIFYHIFHLCVGMHGHLRIHCCPTCCEHYCSGHQDSIVTRVPGDAHACNRDAICPPLHLAADLSETNELRTQLLYGRVGYLSVLLFLSANAGLRLSDHADLIGAIIQMVSSLLHTKFPYSSCPFFVPRNG